MEELKMFSFNLLNHIVVHLLHLKHIYLSFLYIQPTVWDNAIQVIN